MYLNSWSLGFCFLAYPRTVHIPLLLVVIDSCSSVGKHKLQSSVCCDVHVCTGNNGTCGIWEVRRCVPKRCWPSAELWGSSQILSRASSTAGDTEVVSGWRLWEPVVCSFAVLLWALFAAATGCERLSFTQRWNQSWTGLFSSCLCHILDLNPCCPPQTVQHPSVGDFQTFTPWVQLDRATGGF